MNIKILIIALIKNGDAILFRKKPQGSPPYKETWYMFGTELKEVHSWQAQIVEAIKNQTGIKITITKTLSWDTEIKPDETGTETGYIYLDCECKYVSGDLTLSTGIEKLEWVPITELKNYDIVPPSIKLLTKQGYL